MPQHPGILIFTLCFPSLGTAWKNEHQASLEAEISPEASGAMGHPPGTNPDPAQQIWGVEISWAKPKEWGNTLNQPGKCCVFFPD